MSTATSADTTPAMLGGTPAVTLDQTDAMRWPLITDADRKAVLDVLDSGHLSIHPVVAELEADYQRWLGVKHAVAHCNGTSAIHGAMHAFDIRPGDEVLVPSATWWASVMPILHAGGIPVFVETEPECGGLDPEDVERKITPHTKAMVVVHIFGMPSKMNELLAIAKKHNLKVLEDASHAHGATYHGKKIGTLGDAAVFSMQANKLVPSAEGGMLVTNDSGIYEKVLRFGHYERLLALESPNKRFAATGFGFKFRMSPLSAAVARVQLQRLDERNDQRNHNCIYVSRALAEMGIHPFLPPQGVERTYFEFLVGCDPAKTGLPAPLLAKALQAEGAHVAAPRYPLLHQQPMFTDGTWIEVARLQNFSERALPQYDPRDLPRTMAGNAMLLKLPAFPNAEQNLLDQYVFAFRKVLSHAKDIAQEAA